LISILKQWAVILSVKYPIPVIVIIARVPISISICIILIRVNDLTAVVLFIIFTVSIKVRDAIAEWDRLPLTCTHLRQLLIIEVEITAPCAAVTISTTWLIHLCGLYKTSGVLTIICSAVFSELITI
jgi:hypothetical protein